MIIKCIICDKEFESEELLKKHVDVHLSESILNQIIETSEKKISIRHNNKSLNLKKIFSEEKFEDLIESKINNITNIHELIPRRNFIEQIKKINRRNPFCYIPYFVEDFINGLAGSELQKKYHIWYRPDLDYIVKDIFQLSEKRYLSSRIENTREFNLKNINWKKKYLEIIDNCKFFENELNELIFYNALQSQILVLLMDSPLEKSEIYLKCSEEKEHYTLFKFMTSELQTLFDKQFEIDSENKIDEILYELKKQNIVLRPKRDPTKLSVRFPIDEIKKYILRKLNLEKTILYSHLRTEINEYFPGLRLIPGFGAFTAAWKELDKEKIIHIEYRSSRKNDIVFFINSDFEKIDDTVRSINSTQIPFKGRKITPDTFVSELLELEKGDFDDDDDQVTRLAGLVLAESVNLQSTPENISGFDFTINIQDYHFRPEQLESMEKLNFTMNSKIIHVKVMINEFLTLKKYENFIEKIPKNEQCIIITFKKIPLNVKKLLDNDTTLQIINEQGVKIWASITSVLPSRVNSICKIHSDPLSKLENKLVKINSVFYEKGIALVDVFPEMDEVTVLARSLEEISLYESHPSIFNSTSKNYFEFMKILSNCTTRDDLEDGFFKNKFTDNSKSSKTTFKLNFDYNEVNLDLNGYKKRDIFNCNCMKYAENSLQLCSHLVTTLDYVFRNSFYGNDTWNESNQMKEALELFLKQNIAIILDRLEVVEEYGRIKGDQRLFDYVSGTIKTKKSS